jgi:hypothetical protein
LHPFDSEAMLKTGECSSRSKGRFPNRRGHRRIVPDHFDYELLRLTQSTGLDLNDLTPNPSSHQPSWTYLDDNLDVADNQHNPIKITSADRVLSPAETTMSCRLRPVEGRGSGR